MLASVVIIILQFAIVQTAWNEAIVYAKAGSFKGFVRDLDVFDKAARVEKYLGIPYAEAPVGTRRFRKPELKAPLKSTFKATGYGPSCMQQEIGMIGPRDPNVNINSFSEDCLFLNIHKPFMEVNDLVHLSPLPVMVWFHGGGFICGTTEFYHADWLSVFGDVIVVTVNYRLSVWGFLSTGDHIAPGNLGLWDQHTALKWINGNIKAFGGDPDMVTIFGQSAGGSSVVYQAMFPENKGFVHKAIAMAGSISCPWSYQLNPKQTTLRLSRILGCDSSSDLEQIVACIEGKSTDELNSALNNKDNHFVKFPMELVTVIDGEFLKEHPASVLNQHSVKSADSHHFFSTLDFMTGITANEGGMMVHPFVGVYDSENYPKSREELEAEIVPEITRLMFGKDATEEINDMIIHEYTEHRSPDALGNVRNAFIKMSSDYVFDVHAKLVADLHANISRKTTYAYVVDESPSKSFPGKPSWLKGAMHAEELIFLFGYDTEGIARWSTPYSQDYSPEKWELNMSKLFMRLLTNFVKSGYVIVFISYIINV